MDDFSFNMRLSLRITGPLYAFLFHSTQRRFLGITIGAWLKNLPLLFSMLALLLRWPLIWIVLGIILAILIRIIYWRVKRVGYISFILVGDQNSPPESAMLADDQKVFIQATGMFSVKDWQDFVFQRPAEYWRVPLGDHGIMVSHPSGHFLYQFIQPRALEHFESGLLCFGKQPQPALAITFLSTWGPESETINFQFYAPSKNSSSAKFRQKIFLTFGEEADRNAVWQSLLIGAGQPISERI